MNKKGPVTALIARYVRSMATTAPREVTKLRSKWKGTISDRERFKRQMRGLSVDRCFNMEFGYWDENFEVWPMFRDNGISTNAQADIALSFDRVAVVGTRWMHPPFPDKVIRENETTRIIQNGDGLLAEVLKDGHASIPHFLESSIKTPDDWKRCKEEQFRRDDPVRKIDLAAIKKLYPADRDFPLAVDTGSMIGRVRDILTVEGLAYATYDYPEMVEDMVETSCVLIEDFLDQVLPALDFDLAWGWEDICYNRGPLVSLDFFEHVLVPRFQRISAKLRKHGVDVCFTDCDGDLRPIIPMLLKGGLNALFPFEVNGNGSPVEVLERYEGRIGILGGVDKMVMAQGPKPVRAYLESLQPWVEKGRFIPFCDHRCPPNVSQPDYLAYLDIKEELFGLH
jgi:uroporphyrinogen decarboxylase